MDFSGQFFTVLTLAVEQVMSEGKVTYGNLHKYLPGDWNKEDVHAE